MNELVARARASARSARLLLETGDTIGAVSRAYYAMFDLARAALRDIDPKLAAAKTHATIISRFSKHIVKEKGYSPELARALRRAFDARLVADYSYDTVTMEVAAEVVDGMDRFLADITRALGDES